MVAAIVSLQFGSALARTHFEALGPTGAAALRLFFGAAVLLVVVRPAVRRWTRDVWASVVLLGVALGGMNLLIYLAIDEIPLGAAVTIEFMGPLLVALVQTRRLLDAGWVALAAAGVVLLGTDGGGATSVLGIALACAAALCWAGYILASANLGRRAPGLDGLAVAVGVAALVVVPIGIGPAAAGVVAEPSLLLVFLGVALLTSSIPYALEFAALRRLPTRVFGVLSALGPAIASLAGLLVLGEELGWRQILALVLVSGASIGITLGRRSRSSGSDPAP